ncbi:TPA: hypothetical protein JAX41_004735 [Enterobacter roggenkampii]|nr:hypothetical protein [Enterobacter roggenkampii]
MDNNELYYLQDSRNFSGNDLLWWGRNGAGYVTDLRKAQTFTRLEALQQNTARETDIPWPKDYADAHIKYAVDSQDVSLSTALEGKNITLRKATKERNISPRYNCPDCGRFITEAEYYAGPYNGGTCTRCEGDR